MKRLETERLLLRGWQLEDLEDMFAYASQPEVGPDAGWEPHKDIKTSRDIIECFIKNDDVWAIVNKENGKVIGSIGLHFDEKRATVNAKMLGYVLSKDYWGNGFVTEAAKRVIKYAFEEELLEIVSCYHYPLNIKSKRVIEKCNFKFEGILRCAMKIYDGTVYDELCYSITKEEYEASL
jgi:[ribosomal protein S5]-alanine N-acetyltransferase